MRLIHIFFLRSTGREFLEAFFAAAQALVHQALQQSKEVQTAVAVFLLRLLGVTREWMSHANEAEEQENRSRGRKRKGGYDERSSLDQSTGTLSTEDAASIRRLWARLLQLFRCEGTVPSLIPQVDYGQRSCCG